MAEGGQRTTRRDFILCEIHPNDKASIYCEYHSVVCCLTCAWEEHHDCKPKPCKLEDAVEKIQNEQSTWMDQINSYSESYKSITGTLRKQIQSLEETETSILDDFTAIRDDITSKLSEFEQQLRNDVHGTISDKRKKMVETLANLEVQKESLDKTNSDVQDLLRMKDPMVVTSFVKCKDLINSFDFHLEDLSSLPKFKVSKETFSFLKCTAIGKLSKDDGDYENTASSSALSSTDETNKDKDDETLMSDIVPDNTGAKPKLKQERSGITFGKIFRLFKFRSSPHEVDVKAKSNPVPLLLAESGKVEDEDWFHGNISRDVAHSRLIGNGDYLLRAKPNQATGCTDYVLSVCSKMHHHAFIKGVKGGWKFKGKRFTSPENLIKHLHYTMTPLISASHKVVLRTPVDDRPLSEADITAPETLKRLQSCTDDDEGYTDVFDVDERITTETQDQGVIADADDQTNDIDRRGVNTSTYELWSPPPEAAPEYEFCCDISEMQWFHGCLPRENAERRLASDGDFLVREHREGERVEYILSVFWKGPRHFKYQKTFYTQPHNHVQYYLGSEVSISASSGVKLRNPVVRESWEIRNGDIEIDLQNKHTRGSFGDIHEGIYKLVHEKVCLHMAPEDLSEEDRKLFLGEAQILCQFQHPNVIKCFGIAMDYDPIMVVTEHIASNKLVGFLREKGSTLDAKRKTEICLDVARAIDYIQERKCIHRSIAAMACQLGAEGVVKLSNFSLCNKMDSLRSRSRTFVVPVKWTAPEIFRSSDFQHSFCLQSDLWSFGVLLWEVFSNGKPPYSGKRNAEAVDFILSGQRLPPPPGTPLFMTEMVSRCWNDEPNRRPNIKHILQWLKSALKSSSIENFRLPPQPPPPPSRKAESDGQRPFPVNRLEPPGLNRRPLPVPPPLLEKINQPTVKEKPQRRPPPPIPTESDEEEDDDDYLS